jgi:glycosyltransferase involved in cell wall biosynthesis
MVCRHRSRPLEVVDSVKIGIDISLAVGEKAGVGHYSWELVKALCELDHKNEYILFPIFYFHRHPKFKSLPAFPQTNVRYHHANQSTQEAIDMWERPMTNRKEMLPQTDILHTTTVCAPKDHYGKMIFTAYDVSFLPFPEFHTEANRIVCMRGTLDAMLYADKIIAISHHTKRDLIHYLTIPEDRIAVTHLAQRPHFRPVENTNVLDAVLAKYKLSSPYILTVGSLEPRKNHTAIIKAYNALPRPVQNNYDLVFAGGSGWLNSGVFQLVKELRLEHRVRFLGYVTDEDLPALYSGTSAFVYPSFYEGFGLPVLEAMACGAPVITSNVSSIPELVADAGVLIDPNDVEQLLHELRTVLEDDLRRKQLSSLGLTQAAKFSWKKTAEATLKIYNEVSTLERR